MKKRLAFCAVFLTLLSSVGLMAGCGSSSSSGSGSKISKIGEISANISIAPPTKSISDISFDQPSIELASTDESASELTSIKDYVNNTIGTDAIVNAMSSADTTGKLEWSVSFPHDDYMVIEATAVEHADVTPEMIEGLNNSFKKPYKQWIDTAPSSGIRLFDFKLIVLNDDGSTITSVTFTPSDADNF